MKGCGLVSCRNQRGIWITRCRHSAQKQRPRGWRRRALENVEGSPPNKADALTTSLLRQAGNMPEELCARAAVRGHDAGDTASGSDSCCPNDNCTGRPGEGRLVRHGRRAPGGEQRADVCRSYRRRRGELRRPPMPKSEAEPRGGVARHVARTGGQTFFARARTQRPPDRAVALARRRALAASGPMPPALAAQFTTGELAVLRTVADEIEAKGRCDRTYGELAARAGVGISTAKNAVRRAGRLELLRIALRPRPGRRI